MRVPEAHVRLVRRTGRPAEHDRRARRGSEEDAVIVHELDDVPEWAESLRCGRCKTVWEEDPDLGWLSDGWTLVCERCEEERGRGKGHGGFIPLGGVPGRASASVGGQPWRPGSSRAPGGAHEA